jgi:hypothetical protein
MQYYILQSVMQNVGAYAAPQDEQLAEIDSPGRALSQESGTITPPKPASAVGLAEDISGPRLVTIRRRPG